MTKTMHADEVRIGEDLVRALVAAQFPAWAEEELAAVESTGTDHAIWRLGDELAVRMPRTPGAALQTARVAQWLPTLAPHLSIAVAAPVAVGEPGEGYPFAWTVNPWIEGEPAANGRTIKGRRPFLALGRFIHDLHGIDPTGGPLPGPENFWRGEPLKARNDATLAAFEQIANELSLPLMTRAWKKALAAPRYEGPGCWIHGDLAPGNVIVADNRVAAVIDWGGMAVGDPACDYALVWSLAKPGGTPVWDLATRADAATITRARGWALSVAAIQLPYYRETNPELASQARRTIHAVLADKS